MPSAMSRPFHAAAVAALAVGMLVGCGSGPSQIGAAAIVGDTAIPLDEVQQQLDTVLTREGAEAQAQLVAGNQLDDVSRQIVTLAIRHELTTAAARREGISVSDKQVSELVDELGGAQAASAGTVFDAEGFRTRARDQLLAIELGRKALPRLSATIRLTTVDTRAEAMRRVQQLAQAGPQGARRLIEADVRQGVTAAVDEQIVAADNPTFASAPIFGVDEGTVVAFPSDQESGSWLVMVVTERTDRRTPDAPIEGVDPAVLEAVGIRQLAAVAEDLGVRVNPRFGVWDQISLQAVANDNETTGFIAPLREAPAAS